MHLQLPVHRFLQPLLMSFRNELTTTGKSGQCGFHFPFTFFQPKFWVDGLCQKMLWKKALCAFCTSAPSVEGMCSMANPSSAIIAWRVSLTLTWEEIFLYITQTKPWRYLKSLAEMVLFTPLEPNWANIGVISGITFHTSHAFFIPMPLKNLVVSEPVSAWKNKMALHFCPPRVFASLWIAYTLKRKHVQYTWID